MAQQFDDNNATTIPKRVDFVLHNATNDSPYRYENTTRIEPGCLRTDTTTGVPWPPCPRWRGCGEAAPSASHAPTEAREKSNVLETATKLPNPTRLSSPLLELCEKSYPSVSCWFVFFHSLIVLWRFIPKSHFYLIHCSLTCKPEPEPSCVMIHSRWDQAAGVAIEKKNTTPTKPEESTFSGCVSWE